MKTITEERKFLKEHNGSGHYKMEVTRSHGDAFIQCQCGATKWVPLKMWKQPHPAIQF